MVLVALVALVVMVELAVEVDQAVVLDLQVELIHLQVNLMVDFTVVVVVLGVIATLLFLMVVLEVEAVSVLLAQDASVNSQALVLVLLVHQEVRLHLQMQVLIHGLPPLELLKYP
jgi:hypothetical protein